MRFDGVTGICLLAIASTSLADIIPANHILWGQSGPSHTLEKRAATATTTTTVKTTTTSTVKGSSTSAAATKVADSACSNGPLTRQCWSNGYSAATDFDAKWPTTGKTVFYSLELTNGTCNPDGHGELPCQLWNKQYPGPVIAANWGDMISITVKNSLQNNGTGIHWHGIRQLGSNPQDGVPGLTECPIAPGDSKTYTFQATQFGTTWYHSHWSSQYGAGAFGSMVINGPASANYDYDLGPYVVNDYYYRTGWQIEAEAHANLQAAQAPPPADTILINGTNKAGSAGSYNKVSKLVKGKKYRLRLINASSDNNIRVSLDNHPFTIITSDLVPIKPIVATSALLAVGQRYDVIFTANQTVGNYWFRASAVGACASSNNGAGQSIFSYNGADNSDPTSTAYALPDGCAEETNLVPWVANTVDSTAFVQQVGTLDVDLAFKAGNVTTNGGNIVLWGVNLTAMDIQWDKPTAQYVKDGNTSYPNVYNLIEIPNEGTWSYWIIQEPSNTPVPIPHPIHLHGHDFYVLGTGSGMFDINSSPSTLKYKNPTRRDTALLPGGGWLAIAFPADNPGAWLMHCHIAWHVSDGLAVQFLESKSTMPLGGADFDRTCSNWSKYQKTMVYPKVDSGL